MTRSLAGISICAVFLLTINYSFGQNIHYTQFDATPLLVNPAYTGLFDGNLRANGIYHNQWASATLPYTTIALSADKKVLADNRNDYLAVGAQFMKDILGDGNLSNLSILFSAAGHKFLGTTDSDGNRRFLLSAGIEGGYVHNSYDVSGIFFDNTYEHHGNWIMPIIKPQPDHYVVNSGVSFSHFFSNKFSYTVGASANYLTQPKDSSGRTLNRQSHSDLNYILSFNAMACVSERFSVRPGIFYQLYKMNNDLIAGNEFHYKITGRQSGKKAAMAVFAGIWYSSAKVYSITTGIEHNILRVCLGYEINSAPGLDGGGGGFNLSLKFIHPDSRRTMHKQNLAGKRF